MRFPRISKLLLTRIGFDGQSIGHNTLDESISRRLETLRIRDEEGYVSYLDLHPGEWSELIDVVTIPETWFFRNEAAFQALAQHVHSRSTTSSWHHLRVLCLPCATGEEACSLSITLLECAKVLPSFRIDAADVSRRTLALAERALFSARSLRGEGNDLIRAYLEPVDDPVADHLGHPVADYLGQPVADHLGQPVGLRGDHLGHPVGLRGDYLGLPMGRHWRPRPEVTSHIRYLLANLADPRTLHFLGPYDVIFCRNLLIYFDESGQERAIQNLKQLLSPDGILFLGHAEGGAVRDPDLEPAPYHRAFAWIRKKTAQAAGAETRTTFSQRFEPVVSAPDSLRLEVKHGSGDDPLERERERERERELELVARLVTGGHLDQAMSHCLVGLSHHQTDPAWHHMLGLIGDLRGDSSGAEKAFRHALYLDPAYADSLLHLALLLERRGDLAEAHRLRDRLRRGTLRGTHHA